MREGVVRVKVAAPNPTRGRTVVVRVKSRARIDCAGDLGPIQRHGVGRVTQATRAAARPIRPVQGTAENPTVARILSAVNGWQIVETADREERQIVIGGVEVAREGPRVILDNPVQTRGVFESIAPAVQVISVPKLCQPLVTESHACLALPCPGFGRVSAAPFPRRPLTIVIPRGAVNTLDTLFSIFLKTSVFPHTCAPPSRADRRVAYM